jgi:hypothetical protein
MKSIFSPIIKYGNINQSNAIFFIVNIFILRTNIFTSVVNSFENSITTSTIKSSQKFLAKFFKNSMSIKLEFHPKIQFQTSS